MSKLIETEVEFLKSIDAESNENGVYIYTSQNGAEHISLAYILLEYKQYLESKTKEQ